MRRAFALFMMCLSSVFMYSQVPDCSANNTTPTVSDITISDGQEHQAGAFDGHTGVTGNGVISMFTGVCRYFNLPFGNSCGTSCGFTSTKVPPTVIDIQNLIGSGKH